MGPAQRVDAIAQAGIEREGHARARIRAHRRPRMVGGQVEHRRVGQRPGPIRQSALQRLAAQPAPLPHREVGVVQRRDRPRWLAARGERGVGLGQLAQSHPGRPAVEGDVMHMDEEDMDPIVQPPEVAAGHGTICQIERPRRLGLHPGPKIIRAVGGRRDERDGFGRRDALPRPGLVGGQRRTQRLVPVEQPAHRARQRIDVERATQPQRQRDGVFGAVGHQPVEEPQPLLSEGQRRPPVARRPNDRRAHHPRGRLDQPRLGRRRRRVEQRPQRHLDPEHRRDAARHLCRAQRVTAQLEEVVFGADPLHAQHVAPDRGQRGLVRRTRGHIASRERLAVQFGRRQRLAIDLAVGHQRDGIQPYERRWDHMARQ